MKCRQARGQGRGGKMVQGSGSRFGSRFSGRSAASGQRAFARGPRTPNPEPNSAPGTKNPEPHLAGATLVRQGDVWTTQTRTMSSPVVAERARFDPFGSQEDAWLRINRS